MELMKKSEIISSCIRECSHMIHVKGHELAQEYGLTYDQYHILLFIEKNIDEPPSIRDISIRFKIAQNTTSEKVSRLEEKELVKKVTDEKDRRIIRIQILDKGVDIIDKIKKERAHRITYKALMDMSEEDVNKLLESIELLNEKFKEGM